MIQKAPGDFLNSSRNKEYSDGKLNVAGKKSYLVQSQNKRSEISNKRKIEREHERKKERKFLLDTLMPLPLYPPFPMPFSFFLGS